MDRKAINELKRICRHPYAWPGGYQLVAIMSDGEMLCADCCRKEYRSILESTRAGDSSGWRIEGIDVYWEGPSEFCAHCNKEMPSEYGDPDAVEA